MNKYRSRTLKIRMLDRKIAKLILNKVILEEKIMNINVQIDELKDRQAKIVEEMKIYA